MLTHATDGFLEIADGDVEAVRRSVNTVTFLGPGDEKFEAQAFLVLHRKQSQSVCHAALRCRALKRAVVFAVTTAREEALLATGTAELQRLGFEIKEVNLNLSPAMRQVVLRDIPVLRPPGDASGKSLEAEPDLPDKSGSFSGGDKASAIARQAVRQRAHAERNLTRKLEILRASLEQHLLREGSPPAAAPQAPTCEQAAGGGGAPADALVASERARRLQAEALLASVEQRCLALAAELAEAGSRLEESRVAQEVLRQENHNVQRRLKTLEKKARKVESNELPAAARQKAAELVEECARERERNFALLAANRKLDLELADCREQGTALAAQLRAAEQDLAASSAEHDEQIRLRDALGEAQAAIEAERHSREAATARLDTLQARLAGVQRENRKLVRARDDAEKRSASLERELLAMAAVRGEASAAAGAPAPAVASLLPHQLRPPPRPGSLFHPDWDLHGLPCRAAAQVVEAWGSIYNVQLTLEGYPSQYCAAFMVVLREERRKRLYFLFSLKQSKHTLVCVPSRPAADEAALRKLIGEGQKYLKRSGFELDKIPAEEVPAALGSYFHTA